MKNNPYTTYSVFKKIVKEKGLARCGKGGGLF